MPRKHKTNRRKRVSVHVYANILRKRMTKAEIKLWKYLQPAMKDWGVEFVSQGVVAGRFVADFVCYSERLIIEVDGSIHRLARVKAKDKYRSMILTGLGYRILRYSNSQIENNCSSVVRFIRDRLLSVRE